MLYKPAGNLMQCQSQKTATNLLSRNLKANDITFVEARLRLTLSIAAGGVFIMSSPELLPVFCFKVEVKNFCLALFVKPKLLLIAICSRLIQSVTEKHYTQQKYCCKWGWTLEQSAVNRYQQQFRLDE